MLTIFFSLALSFLVTILAIPTIIQVAREKKLFDEPDQRKIHKIGIPSLGGLGVFGGFIISLLLMTAKGNKELQYFVAATITVFFLGIKDDILTITPVKKLTGQFIAAFILIHVGGLQITNLNGFLGVFEIPLFISIPFTFITIVFIINSFNLIDGVDGLVGSIGLVTSLFFGSYFLLAGQPFYSIVGFSLAGSLLAFLIFNFSPAQIFMGDTGSLLTGIVNSVLAVKFIALAGNKASALPLASAPALAIAILIIPIFDTLRVFIMRILNKRSPFSADRTHIHHFLLDLGYTHKKVTLICVLANIGFIAMSFFLQTIGTTLLISILMAVGLSFMFLIKYKRRMLVTPSTKKLLSNKSSRPCFSPLLLALKIVEIN
jgi:UDP-N-acetylmuramyl pentapeptide phosphotransferase/UDP-N-acetylglucosamine-1-phosphate transferase